jgi:hypothetical protein
MHRLDLSKLVGEFKIKETSKDQDCFWRRRRRMAGSLLS